MVAHTRGSEQDRERERERERERLTSGHLLLEHLDHVVVGAGTSDLSKKLIKLRLCHEDTDIVESSTQVILVDSAILVDVHHLEAVLVHLELLLGEALILTPIDDMNGDDVIEMRR